MTTAGHLSGWGGGPDRRRYGRWFRPPSEWELVVEEVPSGADHKLHDPELHGRRRIARTAPVRPSRRRGRAPSIRLEHEPSGWRGLFLCSAFFVQARKPLP